MSKNSKFKTKIILAILVEILICISLTSLVGCDTYYNSSSENNDSISKIEDSSSENSNYVINTGTFDENIKITDGLKTESRYGYLARISGTKLAYDINTNIVYYYFSKGYSGYMAPYYSENGNLYKYTEQGLIELKD